MLEVNPGMERGGAGLLRMVGEAITASVSVPHDRMWDQNFDVAAAHTLSPPLRSRSHVAALQRALAAGAGVHLVGSDHAAFNTTQKALGRADFRDIPVSGNGIEERLSVVWDVLVNGGLGSPSDVARLTSTEAAQIFNLHPAKGVIAPGSDADIVLFDPAGSTTFSAATHHSRIDTSLWEGYTMAGKVAATLSRGRVVYTAAGGLAGPPGSGRFVASRPFGKLYAGLAARGGAKDRMEFPAGAYGPTPVARADGGGEGGQQRTEL